MAKVAVLAPLPAEAVAAQLPDVEVVSVADGHDPEQVCRDAVVCIADWTATHRVAGRLVELLAPTCRLVQVPAAGADSVDVDACRAAGIPVATCAGLNSQAVAEWCVFGAISALRHLSAGDRALREGRFEQLGHARYELGGKVVGIVGMGDIGRAAARLFAAFGCDVRYWTRRRRPPEVEAELGISFRDLDELVREADVLVLVVALTPETRHLIDARRLAAMKPTAVLVNAARGEVTDQQALASALREGRLHGAAIDVFHPEPPPPDHPLLGCDTATLTPHVAGATVESVTRITQRVFDNVRRVLDGQPPVGVLS